MRAQQQTVTVGTSSIVLLPTNPKRRSITFSGDGTNTITLSFVGAIVATKGLVLTPNQNTVTLDYDDIGELLWNAVHVIASASSSFITYFEAFE